MDSKTYTVYFNGTQHIVAVELPIEAIDECTHPGACDADVAYWTPLIDLTLVTLDDMVTYLRETGAWTEEELREDEDLTAQRLVWMLCGDAKQELRELERANQWTN